MRPSSHPPTAHRFPPFIACDPKAAIALLEANWREITACALNAGATTSSLGNVRHTVAAASEIGIETRLASLMVLRLL